MSESRPPSHPPPAAPAGAAADRDDDNDSDSGSDSEFDDATIATLSDYLDGALTAAERAEVERKLASDPTWQRAHAELTLARKFLSGMRKAAAPAAFVDGVAETIHKRSAGRFFARRTLGDRVPLGALLAIALAGIVAIAYVLGSSPTGSLRMDKEQVTPSSGPVVPPP